jgi:hypothetical protein
VHSKFVGKNGFGFGKRKKTKIEKKKNQNFQSAKFFPNHSKATKTTSITIIFILYNTRIMQFSDPVRSAVLQSFAALLLSSQFTH